jgi:hypothetical protein
MRDPAQQVPLLAENLFEVLMGVIGHFTGNLGSRVLGAQSGQRRLVHDQSSHTAQISHEGNRGMLTPASSRRPVGLRLLGQGGALETLLGHATKRLTTESSQVIAKEKLHMRIREEVKKGKDVVLFLGCGSRAFEVLDARTKSQYQHSFLIGIEPNSFALPSEIPSAPAIAFTRGKWQSTLYDLLDHQLIDEINFVAPSGTEAGLERDAKNNSTLMLLSDGLTIVSESHGDFVWLKRLLRSGGEINFYTENQAWAEDYAKSLQDVFGEDNVSVKAVPSNSSGLPHSAILKKNSVTYVVTALSREKAQGTADVAAAAK